MARPKKHSKGRELLTQADLASCFGLSQESISSLTKAGLLIADSDFMYPLRENAERMVASLREKKDSAGVKARIDRLNEEKLQLEIDGIKKKVLPRVELERSWSDAILTARQKILSLGNRISPRIIYCKSEAEAQALIETECNAVLSELARFTGTETADGELPLDAPAK